MKHLDVIIVVIIVAASAFWAIRKMSKSLFKKKDDCSSCTGCPLSQECTSDDKKV